jgi:hypothetical protein
VAASVRRVTLLLTVVLAGSILPAVGSGVVAPVERVFAAKKPNKNRLHVLVVGPAARDARLGMLQKELDDLAWIYRAPVRGGSDVALADLDAWLGERAWDVVVLDLGGVDLDAAGAIETRTKALQGVAGKALANGAICIWVPAPAGSVAGRGGLPSPAGRRFSFSVS